MIEHTRVIVVHEEEIVASSFAMILERNGFTAEYFTNPYMAIESARNDAPHVLISDLLMTQMTGIELAIGVKEICPQCKVLLLSGHAAGADILESARTSGLDFVLLQKPAHPVDLLAAIKRQQVAPIVAIDGNGGHAFRRLQYRQDRWE